MKRSLAGSTRVAMRIVDGATNPTYWLLNDHLGSTAITAFPQKSPPRTLALSSHPVYK